MTEEVKHPKALTLNQFAKEAQISRRTAERMIARGELKVARLGRLIRVPASEVARLLGAALVLIAVLGACTAPVAVHPATEPNQWALALDAAIGIWPEPAPAECQAIPQPVELDHQAQIEAQVVRAVMDCTGEGVDETSERFLDLVIGVRAAMKGGAS